MKTLADKLAEEQARLREILGYYKEIGPAGMFGAAIIEKSLADADRAVMSGDVASMLRALDDLQEIRE